MTEENNIKNFDYMCRRLRRLLQREGRMKEWKARKFYEKPSEKRNRIKKERTKRFLKRMRRRSLVL